MSAPRLLDLFAGAGGAAVGYARAGFEVIGVDIAHQPNYPFEFYQGDALQMLDRGRWGIDGPDVDDFDAIHASPPCQDHSMLRNSAGTHGTGWMLAATLERLRGLPMPWVVENVVGSGLNVQADLFGEFGATLCGASFGLGTDELDLNRHRLFHSNVPISAPPCSHRVGKTLGVYGHGANSWHREMLGRNLTVAEMRSAMGVDWMTREELSQAIPPAYTEHIGAALMAAIRHREATA